MIRVNKLNKEEFYLNPSLIETIEKKPDTVITLINGKKFVVADTVEEILKNIIKYYKTVGLVAPQVVLNEDDIIE